MNRVVSKGIFCQWKTLNKTSAEKNNRQAQIKSPENAMSKGLDKELQNKSFRAPYLDNHKTQTNSKLSLRLYHWRLLQKSLVLTWKTCIYIDIMLRKQVRKEGKTHFMKIKSRIHNINVSSHNQKANWNNNKLQSLERSFKVREASCRRLWIW